MSSLPRRVSDLGVVLSGKGFAALATITKSVIDLIGDPGIAAAASRGESASDLRQIVNLEPGSVDRPGVGYGGNTAVQRKPQGNTRTSERKPCRSR